MLELDVEIDTELRERAIEAIEHFRRHFADAVSRTQLEALKLIAANEPDKVPDFASGQKSKAAKKKQEDQCKFWDFISSLCKGSQSPLKTFKWSLKGYCDACMPADRKTFPSEGKTPADQHANKALRERRKEWEESWRRQHYPPFFRHFCAHYLYRLPPDRR